MRRPPPRPTRSTAVAPPSAPRSARLAVAEQGGDAKQGTFRQDNSAMSEAADGQLQGAVQEGSQQSGQQHVNVEDQLSKPKSLTEGSNNEQPIQSEHVNPHLQLQPENQLQQAETNTFQLAEKETGCFGLESFAGSKVDVAQAAFLSTTAVRLKRSPQRAAPEAAVRCKRTAPPKRTGRQPSKDQQNVKQIVGQQVPSTAQNTKKGPSIPFNMLIPILQAHLDRDKDMQLQTVWAKLKANEVHKDDFLRVIRNIVGDQMLKQAAHKVYLQMQAQAQRNNQANPSQHSLFSQVSPQQISSSGSAHDQQVRAPAPPTQGQKSQVLSSPQTFVPLSSTQSQNSMHYLAHDNPNQNPDAKATNGMLNQAPRMNSAVSLQTRNKQQQPAQFQQASQQIIYGTSNPAAQAYPRSITGSTPLRPPNSVSEPQSSLPADGMSPGKIGPPPTHPSMQQNTVAWQMQQNKELKTNAPKANLVGTGSSSAKLQGKQGPSNTSTPRASGGAKGNKKSGGQKKSLEAAGSAPPPASKKQKTSGAFQEQSIDQLNDVTAVSGVNLREEEEQLLSAPKEESLASQAARRIAQEEEENLFLRKGPLLRKLTEITLKYDLKSISGDVEHCLSMCVEERLRRFISALIRVSKQRIDTEKTGHRLVITSDVGRQILLMNQKAKEEWDKKQAQESDKNKKQTEVDGSATAELEKEKEESRPKNAKPNKEEDDKMRTTAANVAARQAVGGSDMLSKWQLMAEQARQKREGLDVAAASQSGRASAARLLSKTGKGPSEHHDGSKSHLAAFGTGGMKRPGRAPFSGPQRTISVKDVIRVLERETQMAKSGLIYRLYERLPGDSSAD